MLIPGKPKIKLGNFLYKLDNKIKISSNNSYLVDFHKKQNLSFNSVAKKFKISEKTYRYCVNGIRKPTLKFLKELSKKDKKILDFYFNSEIKLTAKNMEVNLPKYLTPKLSYFLGYLQGDGFIGSDKKTYGFADNYLPQLNFINDLNENIFGNRGYIRMKKSKISEEPYPILEVRQYVINSYLHNFWEQSRGKKNNLKIPSIFYKNKEIMRWYLKGIFDAEGTLPRNPKKVKQPFIDIAMKNKSFIEEIKSVLISMFNISTLKIHPRISRSLPIKKETLTWEIQIRKHGEIRNFLEEIGFYHKDKRIRALKLIKLLPE